MPSDASGRCGHCVPACKLVIPGTGFVYAPVAQGQSAGVGYLCLGDQAVIKVPLVYGETAERKIDPAQPWWQRLFGGIQP